MFVLSNSDTVWLVGKFHKWSKIIPKNKELTSKKTYNSLISTFPAWRSSCFSSLSWLTVRKSHSGDLHLIKSMSRPCSCHRCILIPGHEPTSFLHDIGQSQEDPLWESRWSFMSSGSDRDTAHPDTRHTEFVGELSVSLGGGGAGAIFRNFLTGLAPTSTFELLISVNDLLLVSKIFFFRSWLGNIETEDACFDATGVSCFETFLPEASHDFWTLCPEVVETGNL